MIKYILSILSLVFGLCQAVCAESREISVKLDTKNKVTHTEDLGFGFVTFQYITNNGHSARIRVVVENTSVNPHAILVFKRTLSEQQLKSGKPKIDFEKKFPGTKGSRRVEGCGEGGESYSIVTSTETDTLFTIDVPFEKPKALSIPFYIAKYKPKHLIKKGERKINYKILEVGEYKFVVEVEGWTEKSPAYVNAKKSVEDYIASLQDVQFCNNKRHTPTLNAQQRSYKEKRERLIQTITAIIDSNNWMSVDAPYRAYSALIRQLQSINLDNYIVDCGKHRKVRPTHKCNYCSMTAQKLYHQLDDTYQQLYAGRIAKSDAIKTAKAINNCYQSNKGRKKAGAYSGKISEFYNRIINY